MATFLGYVLFPCSRNHASSPNDFFHHTIIIEKLFSVEIGELNQVPSSGGSPHKDLWKPSSSFNKFHSIGLVHDAFQE